jgi:HPt (histidine-containing phosphotransfer) domain-containing protein
MPEMDGYAATARVREWERTAAVGGRIPIVALTANAMAGDREQCLRAGMDDYLAKPFTRQALLAVIQRWVPGNHPRDRAAEPAQGAAPSAASPRPIDAAARRSVNPRTLESMRHMSESLFENVIRVYLRDLPHCVEQICEALAKNDADALRKSAHGLKSSSANVGAERLVEICKDLELTGRSGASAQSVHRIPDIEAESASVRSALQAAVLGEYA